MHALELENGNQLETKCVILAAGFGTRTIIEKSALADLSLPAIKGGKGSSTLLKSRVVLPHVIRTPNRDFACGTHVLSRGGRIHLCWCY